MVSGWYADGWPGPLDPRFAALLRYESIRQRLGDGAVEGESGPIVEWPASWGRWLLAECRAALDDHFRESGALSREEERGLLG